MLCINKRLYSHDGQIKTRLEAFLEMLKNDDASGLAVHAAENDTSERKEKKAC